MAHISEETLRRLAAGAAGEVEIEKLVQHALVCQPCCALAAGHLAGMAAHLKREGPLKALVELTKLESEKAVEALLARADWSSCRGLTPKAQKDRVIQSRTCHSRAFLEVLLAELRSAANSREESELLASLASLAIQGMDARNYPAALKNDLLGEVWTEVANFRRRSAERHHAVAALRRAEQYLAEGTGNPLPKARALSVSASLRAEERHISEAVALLEQCRLIYEDCRDWPLVARTLVHMAYFLADSEPERGLECLDKADPLIPAEEANLRWLAATLRTESLIEAGKVAQALLVFQRAESLLDAQTRPNARLRGKFTAARLLEALGHAKEAECLFEDVIASGLEQEWYHLAFLDFLYLLGFHVRTGAVEKAVEVSRRALAQLDLLELGHDQLRAVWTQLMDAAERRALTSQSLAVAQNYLWVHWKHPAPKMPALRPAQ